MEYNLLYRWFVGLSMNEEVWHPTVFTKNRDRLLEGESHLSRGAETRRRILSESPVVRDDRSKPGRGRRVSNSGMMTTS